MMAMNHILLISKDILKCDYLAPYGGTIDDMPQISAIAKDGTVFMRHYTAAPSTAMAFTSMFTGLYPYQTGRRKYDEVGVFPETTLFDEMYKRGYEVHTLWDERYTYLAEKYSKCYGKNTIQHNVSWLTHDIPPHVKGEYDDLAYIPHYTERLLKEMRSFLRNTVGKKNSVFMWMHLPHVLAGRNSYGSDMDVFDEIVGYCREYFQEIFITADHGHMDGTHGKYGYGFDVFEPAIHIPLITPRIGDLEKVEAVTSNTRLSQLILDRVIPDDEYVMSETAYYQQPHRKLAIIKGKYKYVYDKYSRQTFLFDLENDPSENINLAYPEVYDVDRKRYYAISQRIYYREWNDALKALSDFQSIKQSIWRNPPLIIDLWERTKMNARLFGARLLNK